MVAGLYFFEGKCGDFWRSALVFSKNDHEAGVPSLFREKTEFRLLS